MWNTTGIQRLWRPAECGRSFPWYSSETPLAFNLPLAYRILANSSTGIPVNTCGKSLSSTEIKWKTRYSTMYTSGILAHWSTEKKKQQKTIPAEISPKVVRRQRSIIKWHINMLYSRLVISKSKGLWKTTIYPYLRTSEINWTATFYNSLCYLSPEVREILQKRVDIAPKEQFLLFFLQYFVTCS